MKIWKSISGYKDYKVSTFGKVKITANNATRKER